LSFGIHVTINAFCSALATDVTIQCVTWAVLCAAFVVVYNFGGKCAALLHLGIIRCTFCDIAGITARFLFRVNTLASAALIESRKTAVIICAAGQSGYFTEFTDLNAISTTYFVNPVDTTTGLAFLILVAALVSAVFV